jgi:hypothetical protein
VSDMAPTMARLKADGRGRYSALCGKLAYGLNDKRSYCDGKLANVGYVPDDPGLSDYVRSWRINREMAGLPMALVDGWVAWNPDKLWRKPGDPAATYRAPEMSGTRATPRRQRAHPLYDGTNRRELGRVITEHVAAVPCVIHCGRCGWPSHIVTPA